MNNSSLETTALPSFGDRVRELRLRRNFGYEQIFLKTRISEAFIYALEKEKWDQLPAYAYSRGLLLNLLEFYTVNSQEREEVLGEFSRLAQQSQPPPQESNEDQSKKAEESVKRANPIKLKEESLTVLRRIPGDEVASVSPEEELRKKIFSGTWLSLLVVGLFLLIGILFFYFDVFRDWFSGVDSFSQSSSLIGVDKTTGQVGDGVYSLYSKFNTFDLVKGDVVKVFFDNQIYSFRLNDIVSTFDNKISANFDFNNESIGKVYLFEEIWVDLNQDERDDLLIKFQKISGDVAIVFFLLADETMKNVNYESIWNSQERVSIKKGEFVLLKDQNKSPIQIFIKATILPVHLAYNIDGQRQNTINLSPGNTVNLLANDHLELQIGNFRSVMLVLNLIPITFEMENPNQFGITRIVKWLPSFRNETKYDLVVKDYIE